MKRLGGCLGVAVLGLVFVGCDSGGIEEGVPKDAPKDARPAGFEDMMKGMGDKMKKGGSKGARPAGK